MMIANCNRFNDVWKIFFKSISSGLIASFFTERNKKWENLLSTRNNKDFFVINAMYKKYNEQFCVRLTSLLGTENE